MGGYSKKIIFFILGFFVATGETDADTACPEVAQDDDLPELMKVQLLQSDLSVRRAKSRAGQKEVEASVSQKEAEEDTTRNLDSFRVEQLEAKVGQLEAKMARHDAVVKKSYSLAKTGAAAIAFRSVAMMRHHYNEDNDAAPPSVHLLEQPAGPVGTEVRWFARNLTDQDDPTGTYRCFADCIGNVDFATNAFWGEMSCYRSCFLPTVAVEMVIFAVLYLIIGAVYRAVKSPPEAMQEHHSGQFEEAWNHDLCDCLSDPASCLCACFCPGIRWAETTSYHNNQCGFWGWLLVFILYQGGLTVALFPFVALLNVILLPLLFAGQRANLREKLKIQGSCPMDCCVYAWCTCCALTQDARQVEDAMRSGKKFVGEPVGA